jgi:hypothetical protein
LVEVALDGINSLTLLACKIRTSGEKKNQVLEVGDEAGIRAVEMGGGHISSTIPTKSTCQSGTEIYI